MIETYTDVSGMIVCPACKCDGQLGSLQYRVLPSTRIEFESDDGSHTEYADDIRDYVCKNCDFGFMVEVSQLMGIEKDDSAHPLDNP